MTDDNTPKTAPLTDHEVARLRRLTGEARDAFAKAQDEVDTAGTALARIQTILEGLDECGGEPLDEFAWALPAEHDDIADILANAVNKADGALNALDLVIFTVSEEEGEDEEPSDEGADE
jgi:hypothetical protein